MSGRVSQENTPGRALKGVGLRLRKWVAGTRGLPDFLIIGAQKSATCTLFFNLNRHPELHLAGTVDGLNEVHFFDRDDHWELGLDWYRQQFDRVDVLQGEKTPEYIANLKCHARMAASVPRARLILSLRNPVERAYSQWNHFNQIYELSRAWGWELADFETALELHPELLGRGEYIDQIEHLLGYFPREQLHIGIAERLAAQPRQELNRLCAFLGVRPLEWEIRNIHQRSYDHSLVSGTRARLADHFHAKNERLFEFLGERITEWD